MNKKNIPFDYQRDVAEPLKHIPPQEVAYYFGFLDSIVYNIDHAHHDFRIPMEEVLWFQGGFNFNYYHFCLVAMEADSESRCLYLRPYFRDITYLYGTLRHLYIKIFHTEDDEGVPEEEEDINNWDLSIAHRTQAEVEAIIQSRNRLGTSTQKA